MNEFYVQITVKFFNTHDSVMFGTWVNNEQGLYRLGDKMANMLVPCVVENSNGFKPINREMNELLQEIVPKISKNNKHCTHIDKKYGDYQVHISISK